MKKCFSCMLIIALLGLAGCQPPSNTSQAPTTDNVKSVDAGPKDSAALEAFIKEKQGVVLDVRTPAEYEGGHIPGAILLPLNEVAQKIEALLPDKNAKIVVYCRSGSRSGQAAKIMNDLGYKHVYNFGGISGWNHQLEQGPAQKEAA